MKHRRIVFAGGGTAGHVIPALAVAEVLSESPANELRFIGARRGVEARIVSNAGYDISLLPGRGFKRSLTIRALIWNSKAVGEFLLSSFLTLVSFIKRRPSVVVIVGGYAAAPSALAAVALRIPMGVIQVDSHIGWVNSKAAKRARFVAVADDSNPINNVVATGVPVRRQVVRVSRKLTARPKAKKSLGVSKDRVVVAVVGGSLGSAKLNSVAVDLAKLWQKRSDISLLVIGGLRNNEFADKQNQTDELELTIFEFLDNIEDLYSAADVIVSRAGANAVAEIAAVNIPAVFIPLPTAPGDHQRKNAQPLVDRGSAFLIDEAKLSAASLSEMLEPLIANPELREKMSKAGNEKSVTAAEQVAQLIQDAAD